MINKYEPNVKAIITFLKLLNVKVNNSTVDNTLQSHPDWPSMLCISDSLNEWSIPNGVGKIEKENMDQLPTPFAAYTRYDGESLCIVNSVTPTEVEFYFSKKDKFITEKRELFLEHWTGIYLIAEATNNSGENEYKKVKWNRSLQQTIPATLVLMLLIYAFYSIVSHSNSADKTFNYWGIYIQCLILLSGIIVSCLLLWHEIDGANPLLHKFCTSVSQGNCDAVLNSKHSKVFGWLSWSEVGFFYFTGGLLTLVFITPVTYALALIGYLNILALPYTIFSIYYQARIVRQWCVLCLLVQGLLILGAVNVIFQGFLIPFYHIPATVYIFTALCYLGPVLLWYSIKHYLFRLQEAKNTKREYLRVKFNPDLFETLLKNQKKINTSTEGLGIDIGNPNASNQLIKVCNPYCGPCSRAHPKIEKLLDNIPNLKVKIIFTTPNVKESETFKITAHLLALTSQITDQDKIENILDSWYMQDKKEYDKFRLNYPIDVLLEDQASKIENMFQWCETNNISFTPTFFINGYRLPDVYDIEDLSYFLLE